MRTDVNFKSFFDTVKKAAESRKKVRIIGGNFSFVNQKLKKLHFFKNLWLELAEKRLR